MYVVVRCPQNSDHIEYYTNYTMLGYRFVGVCWCRHGAIFRVASLSPKVMVVFMWGKIIIFTDGLSNCLSQFSGLLAEIMQITCVCSSCFHGCQIYLEQKLPRKWFWVMSAQPALNTSTCVCKMVWKLIFSTHLLHLQLT